MKAPFPYFGGKANVAPLIWDALGDVNYYLEPFCGSAAITLARPAIHNASHEIINDMDCQIANVWRGIKYQPDEVAKYADYPVSHADLIARQRYIIERKESLRAAILADADYCDAKIAGFWIWGMSCWIGRGFCEPLRSGEPQNQVPEVGRKKGVQSGSIRVNSQIPNSRPPGVCSAALAEPSRQVPFVHHGQGIHRECTSGVQAEMLKLSQRLRRVVILCGDWRQGFNTPSILRENCGVFLDPPYSAEAGRDNNIYAHESLDVAHQVREWCKEQEGVCKIVLAGYDGEHNELEARGWKAHWWKAAGGFANLGGQKGKNNRHRERLWLSPLCNAVSLI